MTLKSSAGSDPIGASSPAWDAENVDLSSGDYVPAVTARAFYVGGPVGGTANVVLVTPGGSTVTYHDVVAGSLIPQAFTKILKSGTTGTNIVALS